MKIMVIKLCHSLIIRRCLSVLSEIGHWRTLQFIIVIKAKEHGLCVILHEKMDIVVHDFLKQKGRIFKHGPLF